MILIVGAGGHGQVVADIFRARLAQGLSSDQCAFVDEDRARRGERRGGIAVLGTVDEIRTVSHDAIIVAVGDNAHRGRLFLRLQQSGERFATAQHPCSTAAEDVAIGPGSMLCAGAIVNTGTAVGCNVIVNTGATVDHHSRIENHVHIAPGVHMGGEVIVEQGALVGIGAIVLPRVRIGAWSTVGAGSVVTADVPPHTTVVGGPARVVRVPARL